MCGGRILVHPCSHIGYVSPISHRRVDSSVVQKNVERVASVWLDDYKSHFEFFNSIKLVRKSLHIAVNIDSKKIKSFFVRCFLCNITRGYDYFRLLAFALDIDKEAYHYIIHFISFPISTKTIVCYDVRQIVLRYCQTYRFIKKQLELH